MRFVYIFFVFALGLSSMKQDTHFDVFPFFVPVPGQIHVDSVFQYHGTIFMVSDSLPLFYYQDVTTGVCDNNVCKSASIMLFWDASGNFLGFKIPFGLPLTKTGHKVFNDIDYYLLYTLLNNPYSVLGKLRDNELVARQDGSDPDVDASSGGTIIADKNTIVPGAIFTCYTLWNWVYDTSITKCIRACSEEIIGQVGDKMASFQEVIPTDIHPGQLALCLADLDSAGKLKKIKYQKLLTSELNLMLPLNALLINNFLRRQVFVSPEIEKRLSSCKSLDRAYKNMIGDNPG